MRKSYDLGNSTSAPISLCKIFVNSCNSVLLLVLTLLYCSSSDFKSDMIGVVYTDYQPGFE